MSLHLIRGSVIILFILQLVFPIPIFADALGKFTLVKGNVSLERKGEILSPAVEAPVLNKDLITTGERSRTKLLLNDDSLLAIGQNSSLEITEYLIKGDKREGVFSLSSGKLYTKVKKLLTPDSKFEIHTPTAVAAARGTEWISVVESNPGSIFYSLEDTIIVFNPEFPTQIVTVNDGQFTVVAAGALPTIPAAFSIPMIEGIFNELGVVFEGAAGAGAAGAGAAGAGAVGAGAGAAVLAGLTSGAAITAGGILAAAIGIILILTDGESTTTTQHTATQN